MHNFAFTHADFRQGRDYTSPMLGGGYALWSLVHAGNNMFMVTTDQAYVQLTNWGEATLVEHYRRLRQVIPAMPVPQPNGFGAGQMSSGYHTTCGAH